VRRAFNTFSESTNMSIMGLNLPTDIAWERVCVSGDMTATGACGPSNELPPKWQSSIAVFRYVPEAEYQTYPGRKIVYYKVTCTLTSYQPRADEIEGVVDRAGLRAEEVEDLERRLNSYLPCHGAILQVKVSPSGGATEVPYFIDLQPKQRVLYEQASDTNERASRSLESLNTKKSGGTTVSNERLDIDTGWSAGGGVSVLGTSVNASVSRSGQWGTRDLTQRETSDVRTIDATREARETMSHSTQITQMYTLLQAYHLGTNRAIFYVAPRPHVLERPSGFIRGPREIDGIQEFFLVVNQSADQGVPCLTVRLDTSHWTRVPSMDVERRDVTFPPEPFSVSARAPESSTTPDVIAIGVAPGTTSPASAPTHMRSASSQVTYPAPAGFRIENYEDVTSRLQLQNAPRTTSRVELSEDRHYVTIFGTAVGTARFLTAPIRIPGGRGVPVRTGVQRYDAVDGSVQRQLTLHLVSEGPRLQLGDDARLIVTTRQLCCCPQHPKALPEHIIAFAKGAGQSFREISNSDGSKTVHRDVGQTAGLLSPTMTAREANMIAEEIAVEAKRILLTVAENAPALDTSFLLTQLAQNATSSSFSKPALSLPLTESEHFNDKQIAELAFHLGKDPLTLTWLDAASAPTQVFAEVTGLTGAELTAARLNLLNVPTKKSGSSPSSKY
jgi:hypothetical protein